MLTSELLATEGKGIIIMRVLGGFVVLMLEDY
jgi:hypothetical protein